MGLKETFDKVVAHARRQGCRAVMTSGSCRYRTHDGKMCFAGCLIPDDKYSPTMEGRSCLCPIVREVLEGEGHNVELVNDLQMIHDRTLVEQWEEEFKELAKKYKLEVP